MHFSLHDALYFLTGVAFPTYGVLEWVSKHFGKSIKRLLIRNEREAALYARYKEQAAIGVKLTKKGRTS